MFGKGGEREGAGRKSEKPWVFQKGNKAGVGRTVSPATRQERIAKAQTVAEEASEAAVRLLTKQFRDKELSAKDRREAAIAVLKTANLPVLSAEELDRYSGMTRGSIEREIGFIISGVKKSQPNGNGITSPDKTVAERPVDTVSRLLESLPGKTDDEQNRVSRPVEISQDGQVPQVIEKKEIISGGESVGKNDFRNNRGHLVVDGDAPLPPSGSSE